MEAEKVCERKEKEKKSRLRIWEREKVMVKERRKGNLIVVDKRER